MLNVAVHKNPVCWAAPKIAPMTQRDNVKRLAVVPMIVIARRAAAIYA